MLLRRLLLALPAPAALALVLAVAPALAGDGHDHVEHGRFVLPANADAAAAGPAGRTLASAAASPLAFPFPKVARISMGGGPAAHASRQFGATWQWYNEQAYDIHAPAGTAVLAVASGTVTLATQRSTSSGRSFGSSVFVRADDGTSWAYLHLGPKLRVRKGQRIVRAQQLGTVSPWVSGSPHLHLASTSRTKLDQAIRAAMPGTIAKPPATTLPEVRLGTRPATTPASAKTAKARAAACAKWRARAKRGHPRAWARIAQLCGRTTPIAAPKRPAPPAIGRATPLAPAPGLATFGQPRVRHAYNLSANRKRASRFELGGHALVTHLAAVLDGHGEGRGSDQDVRLLVFADRGGFPDRVLAQTAAHTIVRGAAPAWVQLALLEPLALAPGSYHLGVHSGGSEGVGRYGWTAAPGGMLLDEDGFANGTREFRRPAMFDVALAVQALYQPRPAPPPPPPLECGDRRLATAFFANPDLAGVPAFERCEGSVSDDWGRGSPHRDLPADGFSVRWTGSFELSRGAEYLFTLRSRGGVRAWVDGELVFDRWDEDEGSYRSTLQLAPGLHALKVEYVNREGRAGVWLAWERMRR